MDRPAGNAAPPALRGRARARPSRRGRPGHSPSRWSGSRRGERVSSARHRRRPRGAPATRARRTGELSDMPAATQRTTDAAMRRTPSRSQSAESAPTTSSLKAIWASGALVFCVEIEMRQAHGVAHVAVHNRHQQDRLRLRLNRRPGADMVEQEPGPIGDRDRAQQDSPRPALRDRRRRRMRLAPSLG